MFGNLRNQLQSVNQFVQIQGNRLENDNIKVPDYSEYKDKPVEFIRDILHFECTPKQEDFCRSVLEPPYKTLCISANAMGKSSGAARLAIWWFSTRKPAKVITTAPTQHQVRTILWQEMRAAAREHLPWMELNIDSYERGPNDFMQGITAANETSFQGKHGDNQLFIFDECTGINSQFWTATDSMFKGTGHAWICFFNPTQTDCQAYLEYIGAERSVRKHNTKSWNIIRMPALEHPNIICGLQGKHQPIKNAMSLEQFDRLFRSWSQIVGGKPDSRDVLWPPEDAKWFIRESKQKPRWYRPGPLAEARLLARYPSSSINSIWSDGDWMAATREGVKELPIEKDVIPHIGCDVARFGDDFTEIHARVGFCSIHHEAHNGLPETRVAERLMILAQSLAEWFNKNNRSPNITDLLDPELIPIKIDDAPVGGGVIDILRDNGYRVIPIHASHKAIETLSYPDRRSELWFCVAAMARLDELDLSRLTKQEGGEEILEELRRQALVPTWDFDARQRRRVQQKDEIKDDLGRSPDGMDALNLAYSPDGGYYSIPEIIAPRQKPQ